jgi:large subunit ribosomal protein L21
MNFAIIETGGKQYKIKQGDKLKVEKLEVPEDKGVVFDKVLLVSEANGVKIGTPYIEGAKIEAEAVRQGRDKKKIVFKYHSKNRFKKKKGHRQHFTEVEIKK